MPAGLLNLAGKANEQLARVTRRAPMLSSGKARELTHESWLCDNAPFVKTSGWQPESSLKDGAAQLFAS